MNSLRYRQAPPLLPPIRRPRRAAEPHFQAGIRSWLLGVGAVILAPMVALSLFLVLQVHQAGESATQRELAQRTASTSHAVLERLDSGISYLNALALSDAAISGDLPALYNQAKRIAANFPGATGIGLMGPDLRLRFITAQAHGAPLSAPPDTATAQRVMATGTAAVSGQFKDPVTGKSVVLVAAPVFREGDVAYALLMMLTSDSLTDLLLQQGLPGDWTAAILDRKGHIVARSREAEKFVGTEATPPMLAFLYARKSGYLDSVTKEGTEVWGYVSPITPYRWNVAIGVPTQNLMAPLRTNLGLFLAVTALIFVVGMVAAGLAGKALARWNQRLLAAVRAIKSAETVIYKPSGVTELDQMAKSLIEVNTATQRIRNDLKDSRRERDQANLALEMARTDGLTGLRARARFREDVTAMHRDATADQRLVLLFIDLDRFKAVNDAHGHEAGDGVLMDVGRLFSGLESANCITARWGGDEFVLAFNTPAGLINSRVMALCKAIGTGIQTMGYGLGCSIGVSFWDEHCVSLDDLVKRADVSMYRQKQAHR